MFGATSNKIRNEVISCKVRMTPISDKMWR